MAGLSFVAILPYELARKVNKTKKNLVDTINDFVYLYSQVRLPRNTPDLVNDNTVYDVIGNLVKTLSSGWYPAGSHHVIFNATDLSSGIYFARFTTGNYQQTQKLVLMK